MSNVKTTPTLTPKQEKFAVGIAAGLSQSDAYRAAYSASRMKPEQVWQEASRLRWNHKVARRIEELLTVARVEDLTSVGKELRRTMDLQQEALLDRNHAAVASFQRQLNGAVGLTDRRIVLSYESSLSDQELLERLSGGDPKKLAAARVLLGAPDHFPEPQDIEFEEVSDEALH
jgi:hypothetical protein